MIYKFEEGPTNLQETLSSLDEDLSKETINDAIDFLESKKT